MGVAFNKLLWAMTDGRYCKAVKKTGLNPDVFEERERAIIKSVFNFHSKFKKAPSSEIVAKKFEGLTFTPTEEPIRYVVDSAIREVATREALTAYADLSAMCGPVLEKVQGAEDIEEEEDLFAPMEEDELQAVIDTLRERISNLEGLQTDYTEKTEKYGRGEDVLEEYLARKSGEAYGIPLPFPQISFHMRGLPYGHLVGLLARPGMKKTFILDYCAGHSAQAGYKTLLHSTEMSQLETRWRVAALLFNLPYTKFCHGALDAKDEKRLKKAFKLKKWRPLRQNLHVAGPSSITTVESIESQMDDFGCTVMFLDNIIGLVTDESSDDDHVKVRHLFIRLKDLVVRRKFAGMFTSHQNRTGRGGMASTAYGDAINAYSSFIWQAKAKQEYIDITCLKAREGATDVGFRYKADLNACNWDFIKNITERTQEEIEDAEAKMM